MGVIVESLRFGNGFTFRHFEANLEGQGLVYLRGRNGHGKSSPWEVLQHCLYGSTSRGLRKDQIVSLVPAVPGDECGFWSEVVLRNPDGRWLVRQTRNHSQHKTSQQVLKEVDGGWSDRWENGGCPKRMDDAQKLSASLLGLQQHEFSGCMYLSQDAAHTLIEGTPGEKMRYIAHLFGLDAYDEIHRDLTDQLKRLEQDVGPYDTLQQECVSLREELAELRRAVPNPNLGPLYQNACDVADQHCQMLHRKLMDAIALVTSAEHRERLVERLGGERPDLDRYHKSKQKLDRLRVKRDQLVEALQVAKQRESLEAQLAGLADVRGIDLDEVSSECEELNRQARDLEGRVERQRRRASLLSQVERLEKIDVGQVHESLVERKSELSTARVGLVEATELAEMLATTIQLDHQGHCPTCGQTIDKDTATTTLAQTNATIAEHKSRIEKLKLEIAELSERENSGTKYFQLVEELEKIPSEPLVGLECELGEVVGRLGRLGAERDRISRARLLEDQLLGLAAVGGLDEVLGRIDRVDALVRGLGDEVERGVELAGLVEELDRLADVSVGAARASLELVEDAFDAVNRGRQQLERDHVVYTHNVETLEHVEESLARVESELERLGALRHRQVVLGYGRDAVIRLKRRRLHQLVCSIQDVLPRFGGIMFSHEPTTRFMVDGSDQESLDLFVRRMVSGREVHIPVKAMSGGEKQRLSVALVFTLHALLSPRKRPDLLILDEVDRGLDELGVASLMELVREVRRGYGTVVMTSHRPQISGARFDQVWTVEKSNEESCLTVEQRG